jgi:hypothetical protein
MLIKYNRVKVSMIKKVEMRGSECVLWYKDVLAHSMEERYEARGCCLGREMRI